MKRGSQIDKLVRTARLEKHGVHRPHAGNDDVIAPVGGVGTFEVDCYRLVLSVQFLPEVGPGFVDGGGLDRQQLNSVVAKIELILGLERQPLAHTFGEAFEPSVQRCDRASGGRGRDMDL